jgi:thymidylate synthase
MIVRQTASDVIREVIAEIDMEGLLQKRTEGPNKEKKVQLKEYPSMHFCLEDPTKNWCGLPNLRQQVGLCLVEVTDYLLGANPGFIHHFHPQHEKWLTVRGWEMKARTIDGHERPAGKMNQMLYPYTYGDRIRCWPGSDLPIQDVIRSGVVESHYDYKKTWEQNQDHTYENLFLPTAIDQLEVVIEKLQNNPITRHAIISFWVPTNDHGRAYCPCTMTWQFELREVKRKQQLDMHVTIRSNDAIWGLPFDIFDATIFQQVVAARLGVPVGQYYQTSNNMHYYDRHFHLINNILAEKFELYDHTSFDPLPMWDKDRPWTKEEFDHTIDTLEMLLQDLVGKRVQEPDGYGMFDQLNGYWKNWAYAIACDYHRIQRNYDISLQYLDRVKNEWWLPLAQRLYRSVKVKLDDAMMLEMILERIPGGLCPHLITEFRANWKRAIPVIDERLWK